MLPVSGAAQLKTAGATRLRPISSQRMPYSQFVSPAPYSSSGRKRFQSPSAFACSPQLGTSAGGYGTPGRIRSACAAISGLRRIDVRSMNSAMRACQLLDLRRRGEVHGTGARYDDAAASPESSRRLAARARAAL